MLMLSLLMQSWSVCTHIHPFRQNVKHGCIKDFHYLSAAGGWDEKFLQQESELKRVRSEKANLEQHILGMEGELESLQEEQSKLKDELETQKRTCSGHEQQIETLTSEVITENLNIIYVRDIKLVFF